MVIYVLCKALHCHAGNARFVILHGMTNYHLCANLVKTSNNGFRLKRLRG